MDYFFFLNCNLMMVHLVDLGNDVGHGEAEPLIEGDGSITIGIHSCEQGFSFLPCQGGQRHSKPGGT